MKRLMIFLLEIRITLAHGAMNRAYAKKDMRAARARCDHFMVLVMRRNGLNNQFKEVA